VVTHLSVGNDLKELGGRDCQGIEI